MIIFNKHTNSPRDRGSLTRQAHKTFSGGTLLDLFNVLYVDGGAFPFEYWDQLAKRVQLIYDHFKRSVLDMHIGKGSKSSKKECVFFLSPGFFKRKHTLPAMKNSVNEAMVENTSSVRESHEGKFRQEEREYVNIPKTRSVVVSESFFAFCVHFKYLGSWISFYLRNDYDVGRRIG